MKKLNLLGHKQTEQGFQLTYFYWVGHAHNIYLQYATDFGIIVGACFIGMCFWGIVALYKRRDKCRNEGGLLLILVPLLFGMLEYSWGSGAITIVILFTVWENAMLSKKM